MNDGRIVAVDYHYYANGGCFVDESVLVGPRVLSSRRKCSLTSKNMHRNRWFGSVCRSQRRFCFIWTTSTTFPTWEATQQPAGPTCPPTRRSGASACRRACWWWRTWSMMLPWRWDALQTRSEVNLVPHLVSRWYFPFLMVRCPPGPRNQHVQRSVSHSLQVWVQPGEPAALLGPV